MKKLLIISLVAVTMLSLCACGKTNGKNDSNINNQQDEIGNENSEDSGDDIANGEKDGGNTYTINGITITAEKFSIEPYNDSNGEYTKRIAMEFTIKNDSDLAFGYITSWGGKLKDGYKLKSWANISDLNLKQVPSGGKKTDRAYFLIDDSVDPDEIIASYDFMDYGEEYWADFGKIMSGEMGQEEYNEKYGDYEILEFNIIKE